MCIEAKDTLVNVVSSDKILFKLITNYIQINN